VVSQLDAELAMKHFDLFDVHLNWLPSNRAIYDLLLKVFQKRVEPVLDDVFWRLALFAGYFKSGSNLLGR
jgi:hypothetical protein